MPGSFNPMGAGGIDIDMVDREPLLSPERIAKRQAKLEESINRALLESSELAEELRSNPRILKVMAEQYVKRLTLLSADDPVCQSLEAVFREYNDKLEIIPRLRDYQLRRMMGGTYPFLKDEDQVAP